VRASESRPSRLPKQRTIALTALAAIVAIVALGTTAAITAVRRPPRTPAAVVLITIATLRADFGRRGGIHTETPFLDRLGAAGVTFTAAYAASSWTVPSMASLFTSLPPSAHRVSGIWDTDRHRLQQHVLPASLTTLAERFQQGGYVTIGMPANLHLSHELGFAQGFDYYAGRAGFVDAPRLNNKVRLAFMRAFGRHWADTWKRRPAFVWVHYFDPHFPYFAREPWISRYAPTYARDRRTAAPPKTWAELVRHYAPADPAVTAQLLPLYASEISFLDDALAQLSDRLGLETDDVLLIVTADHGEEFGEHGGLGHGHGLHEELLRVPLLIRWPAGIPGGRRIDEPVTLLDVYPTLLGSPASRRHPGRSDGVSPACCAAAAPRRLRRCSPSCSRRVPT
jgi:arylsulfatase A-like enzyme